MATRPAIAAFVLSILGLTYQMFSLALAYYVDHQYSAFYIVGIYGFYSEFSPLVGFWAASHLLDDKASNRGVWPSMILALGAGSLTSLLITWIIPVNMGAYPGYNVTLPTDIGLTLLPAPLLMVLGGLAGFAAARKPPQAPSPVTAPPASAVT